MVTGASEGIGYAMAKDLGKRGFNVCVIARTKSKLDELVNDLTKLNVKGLSISFDVANATEDQWQSLFQQLDKLNIAVVVNNVGVNYSYPQYFHETDLNEDIRMLKVNCESMIRMTKYILPKLIQKRGGAIINLSSVSSLISTPLLSTYAATKSFVRTFSQSLAAEVKEFNVDVMAITPNVVVSKMTQGVSKHKPRESFVMVNADAMAHQSLNKLGHKTVHSGHCNHCLLNSVICSMPGPLLERHTMNVTKKSKKAAERRINAVLAEAKTK